ncbi:siderophore-iron reductase FhuF [Shimwellia pseudoproteus]|uniref:siderophore-iron reductase FhuF n=1 Tax=Shimwellia pseudoproteus TaxID=570012 RepID=UPI0018EBC834|nr:siderophore-iron reductase FhuF [Shimwellia pseudoproteus]MBJ3813554.1 siderophore-iron reductase FhuF [Shimwellia pseudoproteus]
MALRTASSSAPTLPGTAWSGPLTVAPADVASTLYQSFEQHRPYFNEFINLGGRPAEQQLTFAEWRAPTRLYSLLASYGDHIYRNHPGVQREHKPLKSLWAQWFIGLLIPPLMMALLTQRRGLDISLSGIATGFHETGRAASFWIAAKEDPQLTLLGPRERLGTLWITTVKPVIDTLDASGDINGKLIWSNTGYLVGWFLGELKPLLGDALVSELRHSCFNEKSLLSGADNPLFRTMLVRDGLFVRRTCCQRYRLPDVQRCGDCTLK